MSSDAPMSDAASPLSSSSSSAGSFSIERELPYFTPPSTLSYFWKLPRELHERILNAACGPPALARNTNIARSVDDTTTILSLMKSCRFFYAETLHLLYANVRITRPSVLLSFQQTLAARPLLGHMVRRLHLGADEPLRDDWFPIRDCDCDIDGHLLFKLNLGGSGRKVGSWLGSSSYEYDYDGFEGEDVRANALLKAIEVAKKKLDLQLRSACRGHDGRQIGSDAWHVRVLELQAVMELYYLEMQRREKALAYNAVKSNDDPHTARRSTRGEVKEPAEEGTTLYPRLRVDPGSSGGHDKRASRSYFCVTRADIVARLTSAGAPTDSFSHPLLFAFSEVEWAATTLDGETRGGDNSEGASQDVEERFSILGSPWIAAPALDAATGRVDMRTNDSWDPLDLAGPSIRTLSGNLALARSVVSLTPCVRSLSLTGFFEKVVAGNQAPPHQKLERLTLGPVHPDSAVALKLGKSALDGLQALRIGGNILVGSELRLVAGEEGALPHLSTVQWSMAGKCAEVGPDRAVSIVHKLVELDKSKSDTPAAGNGLSQQRKRKRLAADAEEEDDLGVSGEPRPQARSLYIDVHLHPHDVKSVLESAPSKQATRAWQEGTEVPGVPHRLKVASFAEPHDEADDLPSWANEKTMKALYDEGLMWWEEG